MDNFIILTGAPGSGKSSIVKELRKMEQTCIDEPARQILAEQRSFDGLGVPETSPILFTDLLLSRSIYLYKQMTSNNNKLVIFDRGIPDNVGYARLFGIDGAPMMRASEVFRYHPTVFFTPDWEEIYVNDDERKMSFEHACEFGQYIRDVYLQLGYNIINIPKYSPSKRAQFIIDKLTEKI